MALDRSMKLTILGDASGALRAIDKTDGALGKLGGGLKTLGKYAALGGAAVVAGLAVVGPKLLDAGAQLDLLQKKTQTVFGDQLPVVEKWAAANAAAMGLTKTSAAGLAAGLGDLLIPMGFTREAAAKMSTETIGLAGALAEWSAGKFNAAQVGDVLSKAMLGERDGLKALGIAISEADVQQRLAVNGTAELTGEALLQAKAIATQQLIMEKSTDAQAAYAEGAGGAFRAQQEFSAAIGEAKETMLIALMPALQGVANFMTTQGVPAIQRIAEWMGEKMPEAMARVRAWIDENRPAIEAFFERAREVALALWANFKTGVETILPLLIRLGTWIVGNKPVLIAAIVAIGAAIVLSMGPGTLAVLAILGMITAIGWLRDNWQTALDFIRDKVSAVMDFLGSDKGLLILTVLLGPAGLVLGAVFRFRDDFADAFVAIKDKVMPIIDGIKRAIEAVVDAFARMPSLGSIPGAGAVGAVAGWLPGRASGGPVSAGQPYIVGERRAEVFVPDRAGTILPSTGGMGGTTTVVVNLGAALGTLSEVEEAVWAAIRRGTARGEAF